MTNEPTGALEPDRRELTEGPAYRFSLDRRDFLKTAATGICVVSLLGDGRTRAQESGGRGRGFRQDFPQELAAWLHIGEDGRITVFTGKVEMGQEIRTSLAQAVAEELRVPVSSIELVMGDTDLTPFDMGTFGSMTTPVMAAQLHRVGATAREMLIDLAAGQWKIDRAGLTLEQGKVISAAANKQAGFGELTRGQQITRAVTRDAPVTQPDQWKIAGTSAPNVNAPAIVTGTHMYASDLKLPGMVYGKVLRPPSFGATLASADTRAAEAMHGVKVVKDDGFLGVVAPDVLVASRALESIKAEWKTTPQPSAKELFDYLRKTAREPRRAGYGGGSYETGSVDQAYAASSHQLQRTYTVAYIAHAPLEPRAAVAEWKGDRVTVWTGTQRPFGVRGELAAAFHLSEEKVRVLVPDTGSAYGGKHTGECAIEAARLARGAGVPVKLIWTRQEEFTWAYFRPAGVIDVKSSAKSNGAISSWEFHNYNSGGAGIRTFYEIPNQRIAFHESNSPLRTGSYRALAATANHFARESHMDELAHDVGIDPYEFRLKNLKDDRLRAVFQAAARQFGWGAKPAPGHGFGMGGGFEKGDYIATCAEVAVDPSDGAVRIVRVVTAWDSGAIVNPDNLRNQIEGGTIMAIGGALFEAIQFDDGKILNPLFSKYRVPRFSDVPRVEVVLIDRKDKPSAGAGETSLVGLAPAVGNAIFQAAGVRVRSMPMAPSGLGAQQERASQ